MRGDELDRRAMAMVGRPRPPPLHSSVRIGSCKGNISFKMDQAVFHRDDVSARAEARRIEVDRWKKAKTTSGWRKSTLVDGPVCERRAMENLERDRSHSLRSNFRADEPSTSLAVRDAPEWSKQVGTGTAAARRERELAAARALLLARRNSEQRAGGLRDYVSLPEAVGALNEEIRRQKSEGSFSLTRRVDVQAEPPVDRRTLGNRLAIERPRMQLVSSHSGLWEPSRTDGQRMMWSDTASFRLDSPGDTVFARNLDRRNFGALTLSATSLNAPRRIALLERAALLGKT